MNIGDRLRTLRVERGLQQKELAEKFGILKQTYNRYELGQREPDYNTLSLLAEYFGVTTDWLLGKTEHRKVVIMEKEVIPKELRDIGIDYLKVTQHLKDQGLSPEDIKEIAEVVKRIKGI